MHTKIFNQKNTMKLKELPPFAPTLMESTRAIGYSTKTAIADIIDNSISAEAKNIELDFNPDQNPFVSILDDGFGMTENEVIAAMQYGSKNPLDNRSINDLGRYGLGLKTASLSQCRKLTVISKKNNSISGCQWNLDHIKKQQSWSLIILNYQEILKYPNFNKLNLLKSGTLVIWQDLDKFFLKNRNISSVIANKCIETSAHLSLVFHRYLNGEKGLVKIDIKINDKSIKGKDPFIKNKSEQAMAEEIIVINGEKIIVKPYILPHTSKLTQSEIKELNNDDSLKKYQGFYVYRNKRLLIWGTWFNLLKQSKTTKLARVQIDIPNTLDDLWTLDVKKSTATPPNEVKKHLAHIINKIANTSKRPLTYRGKKELNDDTINFWSRLITRDGGIEYCINKDHPYIQSFLKNNTKISKELDFLLNYISKTLPINSISLDLNQDHKINEDNESDYENILQNLKKLINSEIELKDQLLNVLIKTQPFCNYKNEIEESIKKGDL